ncbi:hypothetical protein PDESU_05742 [Pontiella desulfatans]|uniref:Tetratricopeptide repeat protein n=1 Tax=Pontiella desulfatans TaxID=2750659 RepID=A0A6C2UC15_PONDE|nr:hypothetical protein [Pontiella desulfatans]VGO17147.1 hypothetical protein PDESU_05742 [Pontiella desulfatans]
MKRAFILPFVFAAAVHADEGVLLQRIVALEKRVAELEARLAPVLEEERVKEVAARQKELARTRMMMDGEYLSRNDLNLIEKGYHAANQDWKTEEAKKTVAVLTEKYPRANRTGCAVLALAQASEGDAQIKLLEQAIETHNMCFYANGVQVGAYARLYLGMRLKHDGKDGEAKRLFEELRTAYPDAIDHTGQLLTSHLEGLE